MWSSRTNFHYFFPFFCYRCSQPQGPTHGFSRVRWGLPVQCYHPPPPSLSARNSGSVGGWPSAELYRSCVGPWQKKKLGRFVRNKKSCHPRSRARCGGARDLRTRNTGMHTPRAACTARENADFAALYLPPPSNLFFLSSELFLIPISFSVLFHMTILNVLTGSFSDSGVPPRDQPKRVPWSPLALKLTCQKTEIKKMSPGGPLPLRRSHFREKTQLTHPHAHTGGAAWLAGACHDRRRRGAVHVHGRTRLVIIKTPEPQFNLYCTS